MACVQSVRRHIYHGEPSATSHLSSGMKGISTSVPFVVVYVTVPDAEAGKFVVFVVIYYASFTRKKCCPIEWRELSAGRKLAESIVKEKLAACVNQVPGIESVYWWNDEVQTDSEELLIIKTGGTLLTALTEHVKSNHEYDFPEIIALPIKDGDLRCLEWIKNSTRE